MKKKKGLIINIILSIIGLCTFIAIAIWEIRSDDKEAVEYSENLNKEYNLINFNDNLKIKVLDIYKISSKFRNNPDFMRINTSSYEKYSIGVKYCLNSKGTYLQDVLNIGDSIKKASGSDTLVVINRRGKFYFRLAIVK